MTTLHRMQFCFSRNIFIFFSICILFFYQSSFAQINDDFTDGDFTNSPTWTGDASKFEVDVNKELHLNAPAVTDTAYLFTDQTLLATTEWHFNVRMDFAPSSTNFAKIYLASNASNPKLALNGYYLKIGGITGSDDAVELYRQDGTSSTLLIQGVNGHAADNPNIGVKVLRNSAGMWELYVDTLGGEEYILEGSALDATHSFSSYFIFQCIYTSTRSTLFWLDNVYVGAPIIDNAAPVVTNITPINAYQIDVLFDETVTLSSSQVIANYTASTIGTSVSAVRDASNNKLVHLVFPTPFVNGNSYVLNINNVSDNSGNLMSAYEYVFQFYLPTEFDVVISEIFADPSPVVGLPEYEYIELYNRTTSPISLESWTFKDPSSSTLLNGITIAANDYIVLCNIANAAAFASYPNVYGLSSFPSLNNTSDSIWIVNSQGEIIHFLAYTDDWYKDAIKKSGGWSLEMKDVNSPCLESINWSASNNITGGTPGTMNSNVESLNDTIAPSLIKAYPQNANEIVLFFDKPLKVSSTFDINNYTINNGIGNPTFASIYSQDKKQILIETASPMIAGTLYEIEIQNILGCNNQEIILNNKINIGLPETPIVGDIFINEILFNPPTSGVDYVELYNASSKIIDLKNIYLTENDLVSSSIISSTIIAPEGYLLMPFDYVCVTSNSSIVKSQYNTTAPEKFVDNTLIPNYDDNEGLLSIAYNNGDIIDKLQYDDSWHNALLSSKDGVSLEKINPTLTTQQNNSWNSATQNVGFGTPAYQNSQLVSVDNSSEILSAQPAVFSPNQDGIDDASIIQYQLDQTYYQGSIMVFDARGRKVRTLLENSSLGQAGNTTWNGLNESDELAAIGQYILVLDYFDLDGKHKKAYQTIVLR